MTLTGRTTCISAALLTALLGGCTVTSHTRAPVEDRGMSMGAMSGAPVAAPRVDPATLPGAENAGKPGYYTVRPGDTIMRISNEFSQPWREVVRWNNLENPNAIEVGQVLRVAPPVAAAPAAAAPAVPAAPAAAASAAAPAANGAHQPPVAVATQTTPGLAASAAAPAASTPPPSAGADNVNFIWPASGPVVAAFDEARNKGLGISGKAGDPVLAAADGKVVYAGAGLRGYGNLIILKHNNTFLTAYAHNRTLLVKEDQNVKKGQKIAEMGNTDADRVKLHFEIRRSGKPVDPARYLPTR